MTISSLNRFAAVVVFPLLLVSATGCNQTPTAAITGMNVKDVSLTDVTMVFDVKVDNPYLVSIPLGNLDYALASRGQQFLDGKAALQGTIPAQNSKTLPVPIRVNFLKLFGAVKGARPGASIPYKADMGLSLDLPMVGNKRLPLSKEGTLDIPSKTGVLDKLKDLTK